MFQLFWFLPWLAVTLSAVLLAAFWIEGGTSRPRVAALAAAVSVAACAQFGGASAGVRAAGLAAQTLLAVGMLVRWRLG